MISQAAYFFLVFFDGLCDKALPAADFESLLVLLSVNVFEASVAAFLDVTFFGAFVCDRALPAAVFDFTPVDLLLRTPEAFEAAFGRVTFDFGMSCPLEKDIFHKVIMKRAMSRGKPQENDVKEIKSQDMV